VEQISHNEQVIIRYLLHELSEEEQARFEEAYLSDDSLFEQMRALEEELLEDYVKGDLSGATRRRFERHYLTSDRGREKIRIARDLLQICSVKSNAQKVPNQNLERWDSLPGARLRLLAKQPLALGLGMAAALLLIFGLGLAVELLRLHRRLAMFSEERAVFEQRAYEAERQLASERERLNAERAEIASLRERLRRGNNQSGRLEPERVRTRISENQIALLALTPGMRGGGTPASIAISAGTNFLDLQVNLEEQESAKPRSYRAVVKTVEGEREIWIREGVKPRRSIPFPLVVLRAPVDRFKAAGKQDFMLTLSAPTTGKEKDEEMDIFYFQVTFK
jgi:hypothetical protein